MVEKHEEKTLKDMLRVVFSHYKLFLMGAAGFAIGVMIVSHYIPVKYTATAMFERRGDSAAEGISNVPSESFQAMRPTLQQDLGGGKAVEGAIETLGLIRQLPHDAQGRLTAAGEQAKQEMIRSILANLSVVLKATEQVDSVAVTFSCSNPKLAEAIPNTLVKRYIAWVSEKIIERLRASEGFLQKQVNACNRHLAEMNSRKIEFESKYADLLLNGTTNLQEKVQQSEADLETLARQEKLARQKVNQIRNLAKSLKVKSLQEHLQQIQNEIDSCMSLDQMTAIHPKVRILKAKAENLERQIAETEQAQTLALDGPGRDGIDSGIVLQLGAAESEVQMVRDEIEKLNKRMAVYRSVMGRSIPLREEYQAMLKPLEDQQTAMRRWQQRLTDVQMAIAGELDHRRTQIKEIQTAQKPVKPLFPPLWAVVALAVGGGLVFGYSLAFMGGSLDRTVRGPQEVARKFDVPVLGVISEIETRRQRRLRRVRQAVIGLGLSLGVIASLGTSTYSVVLRLEYPDQYQQWRSATRIMNSADRMGV